VTLFANAKEANMPDAPKPPALTDEQRQAALKKAAEVRKERAQVKEQLKSGKLNLEDVLEQAEKSEVIGKMKVISLLEALPGVGKVRARKIMNELEIAESRRIKGLGARQRQGLLERFGR
jgi:hypothetical protein